MGGSLTGMLHLIGGLDRRSYEPAVVLYEDKPVVAELEKAGIPVYVFSKRRLPKAHGLQGRAGYEKAKSYSAVQTLLRTARVSSTFLLETLPGALRLAKVFKRVRPDLVHACNGFRANMEAIVAARLCRVPCVVHTKGFEKFSFVERWAARGSACVVSMTEAIKKHCVDNGVMPPRYHVVFDGLDLDGFRPRLAAAEVRRGLGVSPDVSVVGVVGHIQEWKGQHVLLEAAGLMAESHPDLSVLIVGGVHSSGLDYSQRLHDLVARNRLDGRVIFTGARDDVSDLMNAMDVVVHTSVRAEPFGRVIIEAMSVGKPVVATRAGGVPELIADGKDGVLVEPGDATALAAELDRLLGDRDLRERLSVGALKKAETFAVENHVEAMTRIYKEVVSGSGVVAERPL